MEQSKKPKKTISYLQAVQQLKKETLASVYLIIGEEKYLHDLLIDKITDLAVEAKTREFNFDLLYASDVDADKVVDIARSYPMMAERRVVVLKDVDSYKQAGLKLLTEYIKKPSPSTSLILTSDKKALTGKAAAEMLSFSTAVDCRQLYENEVSAWIKNYLQAKKIDIDFQAIQLLLTQVGNSLLNLVNELEKVMVNVQPRTKITFEDIKNVTSLSKQNNVFELCDAVGTKNFPRSIALLNNLLDRGEKPTAIISQLTRHFSILMKIKENLRLKKSSLPDLIALTKLNAFFINNFKNQAANFQIEQLKQGFDYLTTADLHIKISYQQPKLVMELLLYKLIKG